MPLIPLNTIYDHGRRMGYAFRPSLRYMSGRWPRRDGDTYGIVAAQPVNPLPSPEPTVDGNDPTGHLRPSEVGGD